VVRELDLLADMGVEVREAVPRGLAAQAGVRADDVIIALNGRLVTTIDDLHRLMMTVPSDQGFEITVVRDEALRTLTVSPVVK
jgi:S1-C subfamily serine protease